MFGVGIEYSNNMANKNNLTSFERLVSKAMRSKQKKQRPCLIWLTGLSASGKSTIANTLDFWLLENGYHSYFLDGDNVRLGLNGDLDFSDKDRTENIRRIGEVSKLFVDAGLIVVCAFISPFRGDRDLVRELLGSHEFIEVYVNTPLLTCEKRDPKGLYKMARDGEIQNFTGVSSEYQSPNRPDIEINAAEISAYESAQIIVDFMAKNDFL